MENVCVDEDENVCLDEDENVCLDKGGGWADEWRYYRQCVNPKSEFILLNY